MQKYFPVLSYNFEGEMRKVLRVFGNSLDTFDIYIYNVGFDGDKTILSPVSDAIILAQS